jgi:hypothetical protein
MAALAVTEGSAQGMYLDLEVRLFDESFRPGTGDQLVLADHLASVFHEGGQNIKGAASEADRLATLKQKPLRREQPKWPKRNRLSVHRIARNVRSFLPVLTCRAYALGVEAGRCQARGALCGIHYRSIEAHRGNRSTGVWAGLGDDRRRSLGMLIPSRITAFGADPPSAHAHANDCFPKPEQSLASAAVVFRSCP